MMGHRQKLKGGDEWDVTTPWRKVMCYLARPGATKRIKMKMNRRARRDAKRALSKEE